MKSDPSASRILPHLFEATTSHFEYSEMCQISSPSKFWRDSKSDHKSYVLWRKHLESNEFDRKFKVRCKYTIDPRMDLISGNLVMANSDSVSAPLVSSRSTTLTPTPKTPKTLKNSESLPENNSGMFETPGQANIAILQLDTAKKKRALLRKNFGKLLQKFQKNNQRQVAESFAPTYYKYQYNCSLYDHLDKPNTSYDSRNYLNCIRVM